MAERLTISEVTRPGNRVVLSKTALAAVAACLLLMGVLGAAYGPLPAHLGRRFAISLPVAFHCIWSLGFVTTTPRVLAHSLAGCLFYGAYAAKMVGLRVRGLPNWALPVLGGTVLTLFVTIWLTAALWLFTRHGIPLT